MMPGTEGMYFYQGIWYRYYQGYWYSAPLRSRGAWVSVQLAAVPPVIIAVPPTEPFVRPGRLLPDTLCRPCSALEGVGKVQELDPAIVRAEVSARQARMNSIERGQGDAR